ncbi:4Fe-4S dicluster domain-containing protein [Candidatus Fermentibacteria bacterium]|nr:4Fe-4S dicluster domain-containing protein [Candidatus Fermentibacteria bacterium]
MEIRTEVCTGCGDCVPTCPYGALSLEKGVAVVGEDCTLCGACESACPFEAIIIRQKSTVRKDVSSYSGILVVAEQRDGQVDSSTLELLGEARRLSEVLGDRVDVLLATADSGEWPQTLIARGADRILLAEHESLGHYGTEPAASLLERVIESESPSVVLAAATTTGRDLMPRVAKRIDTGLTADCTGLRIDPETGLLMQTRPAFGGNIMATIICEGTRPQMATVRPKVMKPIQADDSRRGEVIRLDVSSEELASRTSIVSFEPLEEGTIDITEAERIVSGGRGLKGPEGFSVLEELAELIGASVGASRAVVDAGWIPYPHQVGQTGKTVQPKIYIACGISGAVQHRVGMQSSDLIIAINKDESAPIFEFCDEGFVADLFELVPALVKELRRRDSD